MSAISEHDVTVLHGDVREQLATLADGSVQCVVTSPPYYGLRDYGCDGQIGLEASPAEYVETMRGVFADVRRVLANDGTLWLNIGDSYSSRVAARASSHQDGIHGSDYAKDWLRDKARGLTRMPTVVPEKNLFGIPWRIAFALQDDGWTVRNDIIWAKANCMPESVADRLSRKHEHVFLLTKSARYYFDLDAIREPISETTASRYERPVTLTHHTPGDGRRKVWAPGTRPQADDRKAAHPDGRNPGDVWRLPTQPFAAAHFATMPAELVKRCILAGCPEGGTVLDPFAGSGTTLMVARQLGRKSVGIELNADYIDIIRGRIGQTPFDFGEASA